MRLRTMASIVLGCATFGAIAAIQGELKAGADAPSFSAKGTGGKDYELKSLIKEKPVFLVYWKERCPHNPRATALFNSIAKAYEGKAQMVGVVWTTPEKLDGWGKQFSINHPLIADPDKSIIASYGLSRSIGTYQVGKEGKIVKLFPGYGAAELKDLNEAMAAAAGVNPAELDFSGAPNRITWG